MERRGPDEGGGREERRTSLTDSEVEDEVYSECLVSLSPGGGGGAALLPGALRHLQPRSPYTRDHRRRSAGKRQAPQPPSRPSPTTTPAPAPTPSPDTTPTPSLRPTPTSSPAPTPTPSPTPVTTVQMVLDSGVPSQSFTHLVSHPVLAPLGPATPTHLVSHPVLAPLGPATPTRSASSLTAARNLRIRLIDDDSDSESHLSDSFEEHIVFPRPGPAPGPPLVSQVVVTSTQVMTQTHLDLTSSSPPTRPPPAPTPLQVSSPGMPPPAPRAPGVVCRGRTRRLVHSSSDPGLPRHLRFQPPRSPSLAAAWPLDQVSEEEGEDGVGAGRGGLERSDSTVTVATLQEELLVAPRLKLRVTLTNITALVLVTALAAPHATILLYTSFRLVFGTLFPAYYSYKAVKTKNVKEYVKWMMYWIVFAFFTCFETLTDLFVSFWFPFYYELKILVVLWLLSPATRGSSILYRKFVHPWLARREEDIDQCIAQARQQGYSTVVQLGTKGVNYATTVLMQTAIKGGGGLMNQLRRSYSQSELVGEEGGDMNRNVKALPPHYPQDHYASDYSLDHHTHTSGTSQPQLHTHTTSHPQLDTPESLQLLPHAPESLQLLPHTPESLQLLPHTPESLQLLPHTPESLKLNRQHIATSLGHTSLQQGSQQFQLHSPDVLLHSLQPHLLPPMVTSYGQPGSLQRYEDDPYSSIRYTLSLGTPGSPPQSPVPPQHLTATPQYLTAIPHLTASPQYPTTTPQHLTAIPHLTASPQHPTATPQHLTTSHSLNPDARYSPPLTRHRAKQQQTVLD